MRFLDLELEDPVPDATDKLFERFGQHLEAAGYIARGGQIIDATIVSPNARTVPLSLFACAKPQMPTRPALRWQPRSKP